MTVKAPVHVQAGGPAIADRLRIDAPAAGGAHAKNGTVSKKAATCAFVAGFAGLVVAGFLAYLLYDHWQFLLRV